MIPRSYRSRHSFQKPFGGGSFIIFSAPFTGKDAVRAAYDKKAVWQLAPACGPETAMFTPACIPDNVARALVIDETFIPGVSNQTGGKDMFGVDWECVPSAGGSMVRPGTPFAEDANELLEKLVWPDIDQWDWEGSRRVNKEYLKRPIYEATDGFCSL